MSDNVANKKLLHLAQSHLQDLISSRITCIDGKDEKSTTLFDLQKAMTEKLVSNNKC